MGQDHKAEAPITEHSLRIPSDSRFSRVLVAYHAGDSSVFVPPELQSCYIHTDRAERGRTRFGGAKIHDICWTQPQPNPSAEQHRATLVHEAWGT